MQLVDVEPVDFFNKRGWSVSSLTRENVVTVVAGETPLLCIDGRDGDVAEGVKLPGSVYGIMDMKGLTGEGGFKDAANMVREAGLVPTTHGDDHKQENGCGFKGLNPQLNIDSAVGRQLVEQAGGEYITLEGAHSEVDLIVNDVARTYVHTGRLAGQKHFVADLWFAREIGVPNSKALDQVATTIEKLGGPKVVRIIK